jgi:hypothetical protein
VNVVDVSAILAADELHVFAVNRSLCEPTLARVHPANLSIAALVSDEMALIF